jgi:hypothetical protein
MAVGFAVLKLQGSKLSAFETFGMDILDALFIRQQ